MSIKTNVIAYAKYNIISSIVKVRKNPARTIKELARFKRCVKI